MKRAQFSFSHDKFVLKNLSFYPMVDNSPVAGVICANFFTAHPPGNLKEHVKEQALHFESTVA